MADWKTITFFDDVHFQEEMEGLKPWLAHTVKEDYFYTTDGLRLHYHYAIPKEARGTVVFVHGFCEFFGKYHEVMHYFYEAGYACFFYEQRGHGFSDREIENLSKVIVHSYEDYVQDLREFLKFVVEPKKPQGKIAIFSHSMGGMVTTLFLEMHPGLVDAAILSSPMHAVSTGNLPKPLVSVLKAMAILFRWNEKYCIGQHDFDGIAKPEQSSAKSKERYLYQFQLRKEHPEYQTYGATYGWIIAGLNAGKQMLQHTDAIQEPVLMLRAGCDTMVDVKGQEHFLKRRPDVKVVDFPESKHEIFNASMEERQKYYKEIFLFLDNALNH